jgi:hypothetical protein
MADCTMPFVTLRTHWAPHAKPRGGLPGAYTVVNPHGAPTMPGEHHRLSPHDVKEEGPTCMCACGKRYNQNDDECRRLRVVPVTVDESNFTTANLRIFVILRVNTY